MTRLSAEIRADDIPPPAVRGREMHDDIERARSALWHLDAGCSRNEWVRLGMAACAAGLTFEDFHNWSASAGNYKDEADCRRTWKSFSEDGRVQAGTLFAAARADGWQDERRDRHQTGTQQSPHQKRQEAAQAPRKPEEGKRPPHNPAAVWQAALPAAVEHGYLTRKGMSPNGLRTASAGLHIAGHDCAGWLTLPVWSIERGELQSLQLVSPEAGPPKLSLPGCPISGGVFVVHQDAPEGRPCPEAFAGGVAYLAEGAATAASLYQATGRPSVAVFGKGNFDAIARALRQQYPALRIVLCPDRRAEHKAAAIAADIAGPVAWVALPEDCPPNYDANDYAAAHGLDALAELLKAERTPPQRFKLMSPAELAALPPVRWRVRGVLPSEGIAAIYGQSGSGKSFLVLDMLAAIAAGRPWFGCRVKPAPVLYVALEGEAGIAQRIQAHQKRHGPLAPGFRFLLQPLDIRKQGDRADIITAAKAAGLAGGVLCVDTLSRAAPGMDENAPDDMGQVIDGLKALQAEIGGLVLAVHHSGKDATKGMRGHSSLIAALDAALEVTRTADRREWSASKSKDGRDGDGYPFRLEVIELGTDEDGDIITSCAIEADDSPAPKRQKGLTETQRQGIAAYSCACDEGKGQIDASGKFVGLHLEDWRPYFYQVSTADGTEAKRKAFQRVRTDLQKTGFITVANDVYYVTEPATSIRDAEFAKAASGTAGQQRDMSGTCPGT